MRERERGKERETEIDRAREREKERETEIDSEGGGRETQSSILRKQSRVFEWRIPEAASLAKEREGVTKGEMRGKGGGGGVRIGIFA